MRRAVVVAAVGLSAGGLAVASTGCTTTQERSAELERNAARAAEAKRFTVGRTNTAIKAASVTSLRGEGANAVVVKVVSRAARPQVMVPVGVDLYGAGGESFFTNRVEGLDPALNHLPVAEPGTSWWVHNQLPAEAARRTRVRIGTSRTQVPKQIPRMRISGVRLVDDVGVKVARGTVENLSAVPQRRLTIFGVALRNGKVVAAGRSVVEKLGPKGSRRQRFNIYFTGDPTGAQLEISAPPSILGDA